MTPGDLPPEMAARITIAPAGCWIACAPHDRDGYARYLSRGMHRVVYELLAGPIPSGLVLDHVQARGCISVACVFPGHLEPVPSRINTLRGNSFAAVNARKTHCGACGREYDLLNTYFKPGGGRDCRACIRRRVAEYRGRRHAGRAQLARAA